VLIGGAEQRIELAGIGNVAEYAVVAGLPQLRYRWPLAGGKWVPYANLGAGITYSEINDRQVGTGVATITGKGISPTVSVGGGLEYFVTRNFSLTADLWWLYTWDQTIEIDSVEYSGDISTLQIQIGFRAYLFD
jgi:hypothetical protein